MGHRGIRVILNTSIHSTTNQSRSRPDRSRNTRHQSFLHQSLPSVMGSAVLTATGELIATPSLAELATLFDALPPGGLNSGKIFDFNKENREQAINFRHHHSDKEEALPLSPTAREDKELKRRSSGILLRRLRLLQRVPVAIMGTLLRIRRVEPPCINFDGSALAFALPLSFCHRIEFKGGFGGGEGGFGVEDVVDGGGAKV
jgi:hypothetical protein